MVVTVIGVGILITVAALFPWRLRSSSILRRLRRWWSMRPRRSFMRLLPWWSTLLRRWCMPLHLWWSTLLRQWCMLLLRSSTLPRLFTAPLGLPSAPGGKIGCLCFELSRNQFLLGPFFCKRA